MKELTIENIEARLEQLAIFELRQTARAVGVERPAAETISELRKKIVSIANGTTTPVVSNKDTAARLADRELVKDILAYRKSILGK